MSRLTNSPQFASLYVGDLHPDVTEAMLYEIFNAVGPVGSVRVCRDSVNRKSLGYAYVNFHNVKDAEKALETLNYTSIKGRSCRMMWSQRDPSLRKSGGGASNIVVNNLDRMIDNKALFDTFSLFGKILSCKVASDALGRSFGYGFVHFESEESAKEAIERVNGMQIGEKTVQVSEFKKREKENGGNENYTNLYINNFPKQWDEEKVKEVFSEIGPIKSAVIRTDKKNRRCAFVDFETPQDAKRAVESLDKKDYRTDEQKEKDRGEGNEDELDSDGRSVHQMYVNRAQPKAERQAMLKKMFGSGEGVQLFVKNLDESMTEEKLKDLFQPSGKVASVSLPKDDKGKCKSFGFVCLGSPSDATKAIANLHLKVIDGKPLYICLAEKREVREERKKQQQTTENKHQKGSFKGGKEGGKGSSGKGLGLKAQQIQAFQNFPSMQGGMWNQMSMMPGQRGMSGMMNLPYGSGMMGGMQGSQGMMIPGRGGMSESIQGMQNMMMMNDGMGGMQGLMNMPNAQDMRPGGMPGMSPFLQPKSNSIQQGPMHSQPMMPVPAPVLPQLTAQALAAAPPSVQKQMLGERIYTQVIRYEPQLASKITGMMLEMDNTELLMMLESEAHLKSKVGEAKRVLSGG